MNKYDQIDRELVQFKISSMVKSNPEPFFEEYKKNPESFNGYYVAADLFKETFYPYRKSPDTRNRYNNPLHNSAAVLSSELFQRRIHDDSDKNRDEVIFLTGIPGAGKTSTVISDGKIPEKCRVIFEGQLSNPETSKIKIQQVIDAGLKPLIFVVHVLPEVALDRTFMRFNEMGRGASVHVMSEIQGKLPASLKALHEFFGDKISLTIKDGRDVNHPKLLKGWEHLHILESEGNNEQIKQRLRQAVEERHKSGTISDSCYQQAIGGVPIAVNTRLDDSDNRKLRANESGRGVPAANIATSIVSEIRFKSVLNNMNEVKDLDVINSDSYSRSNYSVFRG